MIPALLDHFAVTCGGGFLGFPTWYAYLPTNADCSPKINNLADVWLIAAAVIEILLRVAALAAIVMVIYGGVQFITTRGEPDKAQKARSTVINALIGLGLAVSAAALVTFVAGNFK